MISFYVASERDALMGVRRVRAGGAGRRRIIIPRPLYALKAALVLISLMYSADLM